MAIHSSIPAWRIPMDRGVWQGYSPWGRKESDTTQRLTLADLAFDSALLTHSLSPVVFLS